MRFTFGGTFVRVKVTEALITYSCEHGCIYCYQQDWSKSSTFLSVGDARAVGELTSETVVLTGGEPTDHPDLPSIVRAVAKGCPGVSLMTRRALSTPELRILQKAGLNRLEMGVDAWTASTARSLARQPVRRDEALRTIESALAMGLEVTVRITVTCLNAREVPEILLTCARLGASRFALSWVQRGCAPDPRLMPDTEANILISKALLQIRRRPSVHLECRGGSKIAPGTRHPLVCAEGRSGLTVLPDGMVVKCQLLREIPENLIGHVTEADRSEFRDRLRRLTHPVRDDYEGTDCMDCASFPACAATGWCHWSAGSTHGSIFSPDHACTGYVTAT